MLGAPQKRGPEGPRTKVLLVAWCLEGHPHTGADGVDTATA